MCAHRAHTSVKRAPGRENVRKFELTWNPLSFCFFGSAFYQPRFSLKARSHMPTRLTLPYPTRWSGTVHSHPKQRGMSHIVVVTGYAGLRCPVDLRIMSQVSRQIAVLQPSGRGVRGVPYPDWTSKLPTIGSLIFNISRFTTRRASCTNGPDCCWNPPVTYPE